MTTEKRRTRTGKPEEAQSMHCLGTKQEPWRKLGWLPTAITFALTMNLDGKQHGNQRVKFFSLIYQVASSQVISDPENPDCFNTTRI